MILEIMPLKLYEKNGNINLCHLNFNKSFVSAQIVPPWGNQLVPELYLKPSDTLPTQYRHIEYSHEEV